MNGLTLIYMIGALAIGLLIGMIIELFIDAETIRELQRKNEKLSLENEQLRREAPYEVVEIVDKRTAWADDIKFGGF